MDKIRCPWAGSDSLYVAYHDEEWGVPILDDRLLFEFLILEGMQAGLSWSTILKKRDNFRNAFDNFEAEKIARYEQNKINALLDNPGIIRNRLKVEAAVQNAKSFLTVLKEFRSFSQYIWQFVNYTPLINHWKTLSDIPAKTSISDQMSTDLKKRNFKFVGSTICYAFMQATGMVNDHIVDCFRYKELSEKRTQLMTHNFS